MAVLTSSLTLDLVVVGVTALVTLLSLLYVYLTSAFDHWKKLGVPYVQPELLFGNLKDNILGKKCIGEVYEDIYKQLDGHTYGGFFKFGTPALLIRDPDLVKDVLMKDFASFHDNDFIVTVEDDPMLGRNPFCLQGDRWKEVRSQLTPSFTAAKIRPLFPLIKEVCGTLQSYLENHTPGPDGLEAKEVSAMFSTDVVASCAFGLNGNSFTDPHAQFREMGRRILEPSFWKNVKHMCIILAPTIARLFKFRFFDETVAVFFRKVVKDTMSYRDQHNVTRNDFLQLMMQLKAKAAADGDAIDGKKQEPFTDEDVAAHAASFLNDGAETSSTTIAHALYELAMNPEVVERLRLDLDKALEASGGVMNDEVLSNVPYLDMVIDETLRKHSAATFLNRLCTKPYDLPLPGGGTFRVPVGTSVVIPVLALHRDPQHYPEPDKFQPERFTEENKESRHNCLYLPFGMGPRKCLGIRFAFAQTRAGLATIVTNFDMKINKKTSVPITPNPELFILSAKGGIWIDFTKRVRN